MNNLSVRFEGDKFSPKMLKTLTGWNLEVIAEYNEIADKGRYKGKKSPYGLAVLELKNNAKKNITEDVQNSLQDLHSNKANLKKAKSEVITLNIHGLKFDNNLLSHEYQKIAKDLHLKFENTGVDSMIISGIRKTKKTTIDNSTKAQARAMIKLWFQNNPESLLKELEKILGSNGIHFSKPSVVRVVKPSKQTKLKNKSISNH
jgi:hypothetical protein